MNDATAGIASVDDDPIGTAEAAAILGISTRNLTRWVREGKVDASKGGDHTRAPHRFRRGDIVELAARIGPVPRSGPRHRPIWPTAPDDDLIGTAEAAAILGEAPHVLRGRAARGTIPHVRHDDGRVVLYRFRRADILALAAAKAVKLQAADEQRTRTGPRLIGATEAGATLGVNRWTVVAWDNQGKFPAFRYAAGGKTTLWRFARADILAFVERSRLEPAGGGNRLADG